MTNIPAVEQDDPAIKCYGVSTGNGNDGVSHMHPDYYVLTDDPWRLAKAACADMFKPGEHGMTWALENMTVDGEAEYTITACISDPPVEDGEDEPAEGESYCDANGAWLILEVFPVEEDEARGQLINIYDSIESALTPEALALVPKED